MHERVAVYCGTRNLYPHMITAAKSLIYHNGADRVVFLTEDDAFPQALPDCISVMNVSGQQYFDHSGPNYIQQWTYMVLIRSALPKLFPQYDRILSLDVDTIVMAPIDGLWNTDISDSYLAAVREKYEGYTYERPLYNAGVMLMNLSKLRRDGMDDRLIQLINTTFLPYNEQDAINQLCYPHITTLPAEYNALSYVTDQVPESAACIRHFANYLRYDMSYQYRKYARISWGNVLANQNKLKGGL